MKSNQNALPASRNHLGGRQGFPVEQVLPAMDPFDVAAFELERAQSSPYRSTSWPWIAGILAIGVIAYARQQRYLRSALHKERRRIIRLRSLVPADRLEALRSKRSKAKSNWARAA